jgi:poly-gamma-glutamate synthesis protein (capsule biosynthesis protein)
MKLDRKVERLSDAPLPVVFTNIQEKDYLALAPLSARAFITEEMRKMIFLEPERFTNATDEEWRAYFFSTEPDGYAEGAHMDLSVIIPFTKTLDQEAVDACTLETVKDYIKAIF